MFVGMEALVIIKIAGLFLGVFKILNIFFWFQLFLQLFLC